ncbi:MAG: GTPase ObgE [Fimbriimonadaceae bacterium]|nr:GTPase ObgE [Fimbriimonadaceae bacterium]
MFLDEVVVEFVSGRGGSGAATFHREKFVPYGGPNGSDGGRGGNVVLIADRAKRTLYDFKLKRRFRADDGEPARGNKTGRDAQDIEIHVPVGTLVTNEETGELMADLSADGMRFVVAKGGKGGYGNLHYTSSVRQAPTISQNGAPGAEVVARLELKLLADVGLIGLPNAGKSTLIAQISAAKPKIADYPFTTIVPNLGVVSVGDETFVVADMPGLIEGASEGHGLGHQFLKHVERTRVLVHVVDAYPIDGTDPLENFDLIEHELELYSKDLFERTRIVALNKIDLLPPDAVDELVHALREKAMDVYPISAVTGQGVEPMLFEVLRLLNESVEPANIPVLVPSGANDDDEAWDVEVRGDGYAVVGKRIERLVAMTKLDNDESLRYLHRRLQRIGVIGRLRDAGAEDGDTVRVGDFEFAFTEDTR